MRSSRTIRALTAVALAAGLSLATAAIATDTATAAAPSSSPSGPSRGPAVASAQTLSTLRAQLRSGQASTSHGVYSPCAAHHFRCQAQYLTKSKDSTKPLAFTKPIGYGADDLAKAYGLTKAPSAGGTIAIIDAGAYPNLESDLSIYRAQYGLPVCSTSNKCLKVVNYKGGKPLEPGTDDLTKLIEEEVAVETALDVDMASAACPTCKIIELQIPALDAAPNDQAAEDVAAKDFGTATKTAVRLGASAVSISYGYDTDAYTDKGAPAKDLTQPGVAIVSSSGDSGTNGNVGQWPQSLPTVISAGGTSLYASSTSKTGFSETAWGGAGSGCSLDLGPASGQPTSVSSACDGHRAASDVSAVADPNTGVAVYDSYSPFFGEPAGFVVVGGTSASSPFIAGLYARSPRVNDLLGPNKLYAAPKSAFNDITLGQNAPRGGCASLGIDDRVCTSGTGWDGPTGLGSPKGLAPFTK